MNIPDRCGIFGYGSLVSPAGIERTLGNVPPDLCVCRLVGYERVWNLVDRVLDEASRLRRAVFLNLRPAAGMRSIGVRFLVDAEQLPDFDRRERRYQRVDITEWMDQPFAEPTFSYLADEPPALPQDAVVMAGYEAMIEDGLRHWGGDFRNEFFLSTHPHSLPIVDGAYGFAPEGD